MTGPAYNSNHTQYPPSNVSSLSTPSYYPVDYHMMSMNPTSHVPGSMYAAHAGGSLYTHTPRLTSNGHPSPQHQASPPLNPTVGTNNNNPDISAQDWKFAADASLNSHKFPPML